MKPYLTVSADVLIVGGGSAGVMAAIRAKQMDPKQKVVVFEKGDMKYSGRQPEEKWLSWEERHWKVFRVDSL